MITDSNIVFNDHLVEGTGEPYQASRYNTVPCHHGKYTVYILVDSYGRFCGVSKIVLSKDFVTEQHKLARTGTLDVEKYYQED